MSHSASGAPPTDFTSSPGIKRTQTDAGLDSISATDTSGNPRALKSARLESSANPVAMYNTGGQNFQGMAGQQQQQAQQQAQQQQGQQQAPQQQQAQTPQQQAQDRAHQQAVQQQYAVNMHPEAARKFSEAIAALRQKIAEHGQDSPEGIAATQQMRNYMMQIQKLKAQQAATAASQQGGASRAAYSSALAAATAAAAAGTAGGQVPGQQALQQQMQQQQAQQQQQQQQAARLQQAQQAQQAQLQHQRLQQQQQQQAAAQGQPVQPTAQHQQQVFVTARKQLDLSRAQVQAITQNLSQPDLNPQQRASLQAQLEEHKKNAAKFESIMQNIVLQHRRNQAQQGVGVPGQAPGQVPQQQPQNIIGVGQPGMQPGQPQQQKQNVNVPPPQRPGQNVPAVSAAQQQAMNMATGQMQMPQGISPQLQNPGPGINRQSTMSPATPQSTPMLKQPSQQQQQPQQVGVSRPPQPQQIGQATAAGQVGQQQIRSPAVTNAQIPTSMAQSPIVGQQPMQIGAPSGLPQQISRPGTAQGMPNPAQNKTPITAAQSPIGPMNPMAAQHPRPDPLRGQKENTIPNRDIPTTLAPREVLPQPVPVARPTLTGGANMPGYHIMGTPALAKAPGFDQDESATLLSKRKLDELMKEIDPDVTLDVEVEELVNELVSEFVDTVTSYACKMAKLRNADNIDIKDIQLILERNYNIRIPGYQGDEIRTVRKFAPTLTHQSRMQQLNQSKALNATMEKEG